MSLNETLLPENIIKNTASKAKIISFDQLRQTSAKNESGRSLRDIPLTPSTGSDNVISFEDLQEKRKKTNAIKSLSNQTGLGLKDAAGVIEAIQSRNNHKNQTLYRYKAKRSNRLPWFITALVFSGLMFYFF